MRLHTPVALGGTLLGRRIGSDPAAANARLHDVPELPNRHPRRRALLPGLRRAGAATGRGRHATPSPSARATIPRSRCASATRRCAVEGELVPVVDIELGPRMACTSSTTSCSGSSRRCGSASWACRTPGKRFFAGLQIFISTAQGPGNIAMSREAPGQIVALRLRPGRGGRRARAPVPDGDEQRRYDFYWQQGLANVFFSRTGLFIDRFTASNDEGLLLLHGYGNVFEKTARRPASSSTSNRARGSGKTRRCAWTP